MSNLRRNFEEQEFYKRLDRRKLGFGICMDYLSLSDNPVIIETGSLRDPEGWESQGNSTAIWNWVISQNPNTRAFSVDIDPRVCGIAGEIAPNVNIINDDSVRYLNSLSPEILSRVTILYLDSYDWSIEHQTQSAAHHLFELAAVWRFLPKGCLIMVDDRHEQNYGKHVLVNAFMHQLKIPPRYEGYQIAWLKK